MSKDFILKTPRGNNLQITLFGINNLSSAPCLILVHGFKGFKDWGFWNYTANHFSGNGYFVISFNFSHNGIGSDLNEFTELDRFAENSFSLEIEELNFLVNSYKRGFFGKSTNEMVGIIGHSRGGAISTLVAAQNNHIKSLAVWASIAKIDRYTKRQKTEWQEKGYLEILNSRTKQIMRLNSTLLDDIENNKDTVLNLEKAVKSLKIPFLIIHGEQDLTVPFKEAELLYKWSDKNKTELNSVPAAGHTFNIVHPFTGSNDKFDNVINITEKFFNKNLYKEITDDKAIN